MTERVNHKRTDMKQFTDWLMADNYNRPLAMSIGVCIGIVLMTAIYIYVIETPPQI